MTLHTWQVRILWTQSGKSLQDFEFHFHPRSLYKETSHSSVSASQALYQAGGMRKPQALLCCPKGSLTSATSSPYYPGLDLVNKWQPSPWESCRLTANMEQLEEDPAFFTLHKHWGLCSPSCSSKNQRISLPPPQQIARFSHDAHPPISSLPFLEIQFESVTTHNGRCQTAGTVPTVFTFYSGCFDCKY